MSKTFSVQKMAIIALMTAVLCILAPISIPVFISPVPVSLGVLAVYLTAYVLSPVDALISVIIYITWYIRASCVLRIFRRTLQACRSDRRLYNRLFIYCVYKLTFYTYEKRYYF